MDITGNEILKSDVQAVKKIDINTVAYDIEDFIGNSDSPDINEKTHDTRPHRSIFKFDIS